jgi:N6-adenosine-specific RNA methylase IME4/ParB-like chromosome segregation protein Spo0J
MSYEIHSIANIFPSMSDAEFAALKADIAEHGQREPIWLFEGKVIDGRHRLRACEQLGKNPLARPYAGTKPVDFVVSLNLHRRHLSDAQRSAVAAEISNLTRGRPEENPPIGGISQARAAEMLNVSQRNVERAAKVKHEAVPEVFDALKAGRVSVSAAATIAEAPLHEQREIVARGEKEILQAAKEIRAKKTDERRAERIEKLVELSRGNTPLGEAGGRFPVIYADPPWRYEHAESESRAIENQYPTMTLGEIMSMPIDDVALDDCILFMWATSPKLAEAFEVLDSWGFTYRTCAVWDKQKIGMGYYFRQQHELLLVATKGEPPTPKPADRPASVFSYKRGPHSSKPVEVYGVIEAMYPELPKLELFCRNPREGWNAWGNQAKAA